MNVRFSDEQEMPQVAEQDGPPVAMRVTETMVALNRRLYRDVKKSKFVTAASPWPARLVNAARERERLTSLDEDEIDGGQIE